MKQKKTKKTRKVDKIAPKTDVEVQVDDKDFSLYRYAKANPDGNLRVEGYTFVIGEKDLVLPEATVEFVKCNIILDNGSSGKVIVNYRVSFTDCGIHTRSYHPVIISSQSTLYDTVMLRCCTGNCIIVRSSCHAYGVFHGSCEIVSGRFDYLVVYDFSTFKATGMSAKRLDLDGLTNSISIVQSQLFPENPDERTTELNMEHLQSVTVLLEENRIIGKVNVENSTITEMKVCDTSIDTLHFKYTTLYRLGINMMSDVKILSAWGSACENHFMPVAHTLTSSNYSYGFEQGSPTLYKKVYLHRFLRSWEEEYVVIELSVPRYAQARYTEYSRKIRVSAATPTKIFRIKCDKAGNAVSLEPMKLPFLAKLISQYNRKFIYKIGKEAVPRRPFELSDRECASGIHGFLDPMEAVNY